MLALCLMLSKTYYAQNYADIIGLGLVCTVQSSEEITSQLGWEPGTSIVGKSTKSEQRCIYLFVVQSSLCVNNEM